MFSPEKLEKILNDLESDKSKFKLVLDKILRFAIETYNSVEELQEELVDIDDTYQAYVDDTDMQYWIKVSDGKIEYQQGVIENTSVQAWLSSDIIIDILKGKAIGSELFMKGVIRAKGSLSNGLRYINLYRQFFKYINEKYKIKGFPG